MLGTKSHAESPRQNPQKGSILKKGSVGMSKAGSQQNSFLDLEK